VVALGSVAVGAAVEPAKLVKVGFWIVALSQSFWDRAAGAEFSQKDNSFN
jgi:hypothetical protein